ncbi:MAG: ribose 5-phosphate isomerase A [Gemmatimonadetes bacterium]|nr:ribose 5-phosphate isomerase A [Gemmatimonadota bacterium]MBI2402437.1 ribose 5-phosphate isomerase A [Gemmatimonadota bacterium]MBI2536760.1 ribose 5-phosphate isomerase A [Gemmatimonadota bacterium]MBI2614998.1 ribose 5-phosphate isomerase A [Gemmatimonadota bacterium]
MSDPAAGAKRQAALRAVARVKSGMVVGLGTGSTARFAVEEIGRRLRAGELRDITGVPTSIATREHATQVGIPLATLNDRPSPDLTIDGADEVDPDGNLIKGHGAALLWEKIVASASKKLIIVVDPAKRVQRLGTTRALPVEVVRFGWKTHEAAIRELGAEPALKRGPDGEPISTDEGHYIIDCTFPGGIGDPEAVDRALQRRPGVVETGLFLGFHPELIVGGQ